MTDYDKLLELMHKYLELFEDLITVENQKTEAVKDYQIADLEECMRKEQASTLALRGYDKKRLELQKQLSFDGLTYRQMIPLMPEEYQYAFSDAFQKLNDAYVLYQATSDCARQIIEVNIHRLGNAIADLQSKSKLSSATVYNQEGSVHPEQQAFRDLKI